MDLKEAIRKRHSVRNYEERSLAPEVACALRESIKRYNEDGGLNIQLITDEPAAFGGRWARYGKFSGVTNYLAMIGKKSDDLDEKLGYYGERLVLEAQALGLNTCWVGLTYSKQAEHLTIGKDEKLVCVIALGYGATQGVTHRIKAIDSVSVNKTGGPLPEWFIAGVESALLAPTAINQQKFKFTLHEGNKVEATHGMGFYAAVDLGIVKYHFEVGAGPENFSWL